MGSLTGNAGAIAAFTGQPFPNGLDLGRCVIQFDIGVFSADPVATFLAGSLVTKGTNGITATDGSATAGVGGVLGVAKWNKANTLYGAVVDEVVVLPGTTVVSLKHPLVSGVKVSAAAGGAPITAGGNYTLSTTNGTLARIGGVVADGQTVYVSYTFTIQNADLDFQGRNFWNGTDDVTIQDGRITVITGWSMLFTTQYNTALQYTLGDALIAGNTGLFTKAAASDAGSASIAVGTVIQVPTATDPYLGLVRNY